MSLLNYQELVWTKPPTAGLRARTLNYQELVSANVCKPTMYGKTVLTLPPKSVKLGKFGKIGKIGKQNFIIIYTLGQAPFKTKGGRGSFVFPRGAMHVQPPKTVVHAPRG